MSSRPTILCFVAYYLPGYRSGGPARTISNFVDHLGDEFDIRIVTWDRDFGDTKPYSAITLDGWNQLGKSQVFYASERTLTLRGIGRLLRDTPHDLLYLNSFFTFSFTTLPLLARRLGMAPKPPCVIAPRGQFSAGAIALKARKKRLYLTVVKVIGIYRYLNWQASSEFEAQDIRREFGNHAENISVAPDLPLKIRAESDARSVQQMRMPGPLRVVFLSRISPMKNLDFLLRALMKVTRPVELAIYGPAEDKQYWSICQNLIERLPKNVTVNYLGEVTPDQVHDAFAAHDLFALPTRGENFGHVILESLTAGTPVLISDQTPWQADNACGVTTLALAEPSRWAEEVNRWAQLNSVQLQSLRLAARSIAEKVLNNEQVVLANKTLFEKVARLL
ncbi:glycosyltransferase family 4 protein [Litoricolaceae bacterium]|nr:glycosyltransferase family 4 protein [Litorivicinaceae bacterium]